MIQRAAVQFMSKALFLARFEQYRPTVTVNVDRTIDHEIRELVEFHLRALRVLRGCSIRTSNRPFVRRTSCPSRNFRIRHHRRATHNARSSSKRGSPSVDGQDVRRTRKGAISIRPLDGEPLLRTSNRPFVRRTSCPSRNFRIRHHRRATHNGRSSSKPASPSVD